jgi:hypothetical protein
MSVSFHSGGETKKRRCDLCDRPHSTIPGYCGCNQYFCNYHENHHPCVALNPCASCGGVSTMYCDHCLDYQNVNGSFCEACMGLHDCEYASDD